MKIRGILFVFLFLILFSSLVIAANETTSPGKTSEKGYSCLASEISKKDSKDISLSDAVFSTIALGSNSKLISKIEGNKSSENCWPSTCTIKDTAQVLFAYNRANKNTKAIEEWLYSHASPADEIAPYLEIDITNHGLSECTISYGTSAHKISINEDQSLSGTGGSCLSVETYYIRVLDSCLNTTFQISCDQDFSTTIFYKRKGGDIFYLTSETQSGSALSTLEEKPTAECFKTGTKCDYEGTLWAVLALQKADKDITSYLSYLLILAQDNSKYFPSAFLYALTSANEQYEQLVKLQKQGKYWEITGSQGKLYDTSLAMLALQNNPEYAELKNAQTYILGQQDSSGCWGNIKDTAFLLYSGWPKSTGSSGSGEVVKQSCVSAEKTCTTETECAEANGVIENYECPGVSKCCSVSPKKKTCIEQNGKQCKDGEVCSGNTVTSSDGSCCVGTCEARQVLVNECPGAGGVCRQVCEDNEEISATKTCGDDINNCCIKKEAGASWIWIILLIILIILVIISILFRHKIQFWYYKRKGKAKITPLAPPSRPPARPLSQQAMSFLPRQPFQRIPAKPMPRKPSLAEKEMEETLRKLKEMHK